MFALEEKCSRIQNKKCFGHRIKLEATEAPIFICH